MRNSARSNRYVGANNPSKRKLLERPVFGTYYTPKPSVDKVRAFSSKFHKTFNRIFTKGDIWENPDTAVAGKERKAFLNPKSFGYK